MSVSATYSSAVSIALAVTLLVSGASKWRHRATFEAALRRLLPMAVWNIPLLNSRRLARVVCLAELLLAASLLTASGSAAQVGAAAAVLLSVIFITATITAMRRGAPCACAGRASSPAGSLEVARAAFFAAVTISLLISRSQEQAAVWQQPRAQLIASLIGGLGLSGVLLTWLYRFRPRRPVLAGRRVISPVPSVGQTDEAGPLLQQQPVRVPRRRFLARGLGIVTAAVGALLIPEAIRKSGMPSPLKSAVAQVLPSSCPAAPCDNCTWGIADCECVPPNCSIISWCVDSAFGLICEAQHSTGNPCTVPRTYCC